MYIIYILVKFFAYSAWGYVALMMFCHDKKYLVGKSLIFGSVRLLMGIFIGAVLIMLASRSLNSITNNRLFIYFLVYPPIRVVEWLLMFLLMKLIYRKRLIAQYSRVFLWILGGVIISCLADIPILLTQGMMLGRIFC